VTRPAVPSLSVLVACAVLAPRPAVALDLAMPFPILGAVAERPEFDSYALPEAPWAGDHLPVQIVEGMVDRRAWRLDAPEASLLDVLAPLRDQLRGAGYAVLLDCETRACGGFDFRFATEVMPEPGMHVDLGGFRFLSAQDGGAAVSLFVSRSGGAVFVQMISVGVEALAPVVPVAPVAPHDLPAPGSDSGSAAPSDLAARLDAGLSVALDDLVFDSGSAALAGGEFPSLAALAGWLAAEPSRRLFLVGHTDGSGALAGNLALSKRRAEAVRKVLVDGYSVTPGQIVAEGVGPLAPRASDLNEEGRLRNRRVEAVPAPTQ
jgi:outer membrane protein OmpA-like peptidoglycan-associated protein